MEPTAGCSGTGEEAMCCSSDVQDAEAITSVVKEYYGKKLASSKDLQTNACLLNHEAMPKHIRDALQLVHPDIKNRCDLIPS